MKIVLATHNKNKIRELSALLSEAFADREDVTVLSMADVGLLDEAEETGTTFLENAIIKAKDGARSGYVAVADDSGLSVDALGGAPGIYSARYAGGDNKSDEKNNAFLLYNLRDVPDEKRTARFTTAIACVFPDGRLITATDSCEGYILREPSGDGGFGYDPLFYFPPLKKTFASLTGEEKNSVSHRGKAFRRFAREFVEIWEKYYADK